MIRALLKGLPLNCPAPYISLSRMAACLRSALAAALNEDLLSCAGLVTFQFVLSVTEVKEKTIVGCDPTGAVEFTLDSDIDRPLCLVGAWCIAASWRVCC
jgi:hypothetical protein